MHKYLVMRRSSEGSEFVPDDWFDFPDDAERDVAMKATRPYYKTYDWRIVTITIQGKMDVLTRNPANSQSDDERAAYDSAKEAEANVVAAATMES